MIISIVVFLLFLVLILRWIEIAVCNEVCVIYCNMIVYIDQLCGVNNDVLPSWHKFYLKYAISGEKSYGAEKKMLEEIAFRRKEIEQLNNCNVQLSFKSSFIKAVVLRKHKLNAQEVQAALMMSEATQKELEANLDFLVGMLNMETRISAGWLFAENRLKSFQHEANSTFYGALEGLCSFPTRSLELYEQQRTRIHYLPTEIGLSKRKKDYLQLQEIEFQKAEGLIREARELIDEDGVRVDVIGEQLLSQQINAFFAGSKSLQTERDIYSNVINQLQTKWKDRNISIFGYSYQNFEHEFVIDGHQCTYNEFIKKYADIVIFVLNGNVGGKTKEEFDIAISSFKEKRHPIIFVYSKEMDSLNEDVELTRNRVNEESQYWQDYTDNDQLRLLILNDLSERLQISYENMMMRRKEILES